MKKTILRTGYALCLTALLLPASLFAQPGKDGAATITTTGAIFNRYTSLSTTALAGNTTITVANVADLSATAITGAANNPYAVSTLAYGDLVMIIKMQGASIGTSDDVTYGAVSATNNAGVYELKVVRGVSGNVIEFCAGLTSNYVVGGTQRVQVVRIPRLSAVTINTGASLTAQGWSAAYTGGVTALEVTGNAAVNGTISVNGLGFRGGAIDNNSAYPGGTNSYVSNTDADGAEKGESIAGYQADYDLLGGRYNRGAAANGGGGGVAHNSAGGGGANAGNGNTWSGQGNMIVNGTNPLAAWALDPGYIANGNTLTTSSGGGRGGYTYSELDMDATTTAPGDGAWTGDFRREVGGLGGRPLAYAANTLYLGGGGGAGDANNFSTMPGGAGGGIIYLLVTGNLSGTGAIMANGAAGGSTFNANNDAPAGGGGGGAIDLNVQGTITALTITADGGAGGNQFSTTTEAEGAGGSGGGGYIRSTGTPAVTVNGGANGFTTSLSLTEFTYNGGTTGGAGAVLTNQAFVPSPAFSCFALPVTLLHFDAQLSAQKDAVLVWNIESDAHLQNFVAEASTDGRTWRTIATLPARTTTGRQLYTTNAGAVLQTTYYRVKLVQADHLFSYSAVKVLFAGGRSVVMVSRQGILLSAISAGATDVKLYNGSGGLAYQKKLAGQSSLTIPTQGFAAGVYYLTLSYTSGKTETLKFVQQ